MDCLIDVDSRKGMHPFWGRWIEEHQYPGKLPLILSHVMCISTYYNTIHIHSAGISHHIAGAADIMDSTIIIRGNSHVSSHVLVMA